ncbi:MAG: hypothetical protein ABL977_06855 [Candidatus Eisenbacteria bacterium]
MPSPLPQEHPATLTWLGRPDTAAVLRIVTRDARTRTRRAVLTWVTGWALAVLAVFLPLLHFVLVPLLLVGTPLLALQRLGERVSVLDVRGTCPGCGVAQEQRIKSAARPRLEFRCDSCRRAIGVVLPPELFER